MASSPSFTCRLCGQQGSPSFEHIPPKSAFNSKPVFLQKGENLFDSSNPLFGKRNRSHRGMGKHSLCETCNKSTGAWYARDYTSFAKQAFALLERCTNGYTGPHSFRIRPHRVLKQVLTMFASAESTDLLLRRPGFKEYLLDPTSIAFPSGLNVYLYYSISSSFRVHGYSVFIPHDGDTPISCSEIAFRPIGLILSYDGIKPHSSMEDITSFKDFAPDDECDVVLDPPVLGLAGGDPGLYRYALSKTGAPL